MSAESFDKLWGPAHLETTSDELSESSGNTFVNDGDEDDDFLKVVDDVDAGLGIGGDPMDFDDDDDKVAYDDRHHFDDMLMEDTKLPPLYYDRPRSPIPAQIVFSSNAREVSPEQSHHHSANNACYLPDIQQLQDQYNQALRKLAKSMRRSDATRSIVKRQRLHHSFSMSFDSSDDDNDFFTSPRCQELEESRKQVLRMICRHSSY